MLRRRYALLGTILLLIILAGMFALPFINRARQQTFPICPRNLRELGQALTLYAMDHQNHLPDRLEDVLLMDINITPEVLICPSSSDEKAGGTTPAEWVSGIRSSMPLSIDDKTDHRRCSYIYVGKGLITKDLTPETILIYEPLANHDNDGINILFGDGHAEFIDRDRARKLIEALPTTRSTTATTSQISR